MEHEDRRHLRARVGCRRDFRRRHRLRHVHASACRSCRLEHAARQRPLGADVSESALRVRQDRVRLLDRDKRENASATVCRQRASGCRGQAGRNRAQRLPDRRPHPHPADPGPHARPCRLHLRPRQGRRRVLGRPDAFAAADALSGNVREVRCRSGAGGGDAAQFHGTLLRYGYVMLHRALPLPFGRKDPAQGQRIFLRGDMSADTPAFETLSIEPVDEHVAIIRLNRPDASNALNTQMGRDLVRYFEDAALDPKSLRCIVLTGAGDKAFCAGGDLKERRGMTDEAWTRQHVIFERMVRALIDCPVPIIGAVNGAAYGGGYEIAGCCDFLYAAESARFALTEVTLGIMPGGGGTQTLPRAVGERRAKELILTGKPFTAVEAHAWGLVNEVFPPSELLPAALATASRIARNAPISVRQAKLSIHRGLQLSLRDGLALEIEAYNRMVPTEDRREGVLAFNEKRPPNFKGR